MTGAEIRIRFDQVAALRERFVTVQLFTRGLLAAHGVSDIADLPEAWQDEIDAQAAGLKTPGELSAELTAIGRELESNAVVRELHKLYGIPDLRPG